MKLFSRINSFQFQTKKNVAFILAGISLLMLVVLCPLGEQSSMATMLDDDDAADDWMFDKSTYTNDPKTGKRVDQYKKEKTPYRDPNAWFDSPMGGFPFFDGFFGGFYEGFNNYFNPFFYFEMSPQLMNEYYFGNDGSGYYPYDGDPNEKENNQ
jgi:hypothetical protein